MTATTTAIRDDTLQSNPAYFRRRRRRSPCTTATAAASSGINDGYDITTINDM